MGRESYTFKRDVKEKVTGLGKIVLKLQDSVNFCNKWKEEVNFGKTAAFETSNMSASQEWTDRLVVWDKTLVWLSIVDIKELILNIFID